MQAPAQICTFSLDRLLLGIDVRHVHEVLSEFPTTPVPLAPAFIRGLMNLRGQIVMVVDLRVRLGLPPRSRLQGEGTKLVVQTAEGLVSLLVDELCDVHDVDATKLEPTPETLQEPLRSMTTNIYRVQEKLLLLLDSQQIACTESLLKLQRILLASADKVTAQEAC